MQEDNKSERHIGKKKLMNKACVNLATVMS